MGDITKMMLAMNKVMPCWGDDLLGKLLAWASATGFMECTAQEPMHTVLMAAAQRFKIEGGEMPDIERMNKYYYPRIRELQQHKAKTPWLPELMERYQVKNWQTFEYTWADDMRPRHL